MVKIEFATGNFWVGDCFDIFPQIPDASVDMVLCDLPYGTTQNKWDSILPLNRLWAEYWRVARPNAAIVLTAQCPFDKVLGVSQLEYLKYEWIWEKSNPTGHLNANKQPMKAHENILLFYKNQSFYFPQKTSGHPKKEAKRTKSSSNYGSQVPTSYSSTDRYPRSVLKFPKDVQTSKLHPTQKPVALFEYLIKTYTNPGDHVLDNTAGSGTTAIAALNTNRLWTCMERDEGYANKALGRIAQHEALLCR